MTEKPLIVEAVSVEVIGAADTTEDPLYEAPAEPGEPQPLATVTMFVAGVERETPVLDRDTLIPAQAVGGPAIIREATATTATDSRAVSPRIFMVGSPANSAEPMRAV